MVVLRVNTGEFIQIGDDVVVRVSRERGNRLLVKVDAPRDRRVRLVTSMPEEASTKETTPCAASAS